MRTFLIAALLLFPAFAIAKTPHTVDFDRGSNDSLAGRAPSNLGEAANLTNDQPAPQSCATNTSTANSDCTSLGGAAAKQGKRYND